MRINKALLVAASGCMITAAATLPAAAGPSHQTATKQFHSTITPKKNVKSGQTLTVKGSGAKKKTDYLCVFIILHKAQYGYDINTAQQVKSNKHGKVTCKQTFHPYTVSVNGKTRHCPLHKADAKKHFSCAVAISTSDRSSATVARFKAHGSK